MCRSIQKAQSLWSKGSARFQCHQLTEDEHGAHGQSSSSCVAENKLLYGFLYEGKKQGKAQNSVRTFLIYPVKRSYKSLFHRMTFQKQLSFQCLWKRSILFHKYHRGDRITVHDMYKTSMLCSHHHEQHYLVEDHQESLLNWWNE